MTKYWQQTNTFPNSTTPYGFDSSTIWNGSQIISPVFYVDGLCGLLNVADSDRFSSPPWPTRRTLSRRFCYMTNIAYTNHKPGSGDVQISTKIFRQAVFVGSQRSQYHPRRHVFCQQRQRLQSVPNHYREIGVRPLTGDSVYLEDTLGAWTNRGLLLNRI